ncbi:LOW QUALITY PROTEIN: chymotrypsin-1 [Drosophila sulfurigaster albostrigata]|uniref:LOW QUALITY PROTEIN: chymotrypsin-1 n=1 Tax=Drosophila sulfurigaster albostrigata TaxID=89887 RepID=UPI002D218AFD|nr:LOW QUALITY PROTEIN: chymotrypsin-1 [Drosophila sulfurigaster albostrigata]
MLSTSHWMRIFTCLLLLLLILGCSIDVTVGKRMPHKFATYGNRIVGGQDAEEGAAPYQVSIQTAWRTNICGGVILDDRWILTAGHCALDFNLADLRIIVGTNERLVPGQILFPDEAIVHSCYDIPAIYTNDIGLFHLNDSIVFNERTQPVQLSREYPPAGATVTLTGWGAPELNWPAMEKLQTINLTVIDHADCKALWDGTDSVDIGHICTFTKEGEGSCNGDSGGPLMWENKLVGLVNWGAPCAVGKPDMHANTIYYTEWIRRTIAGCKQRVN